jgi:hypothetical protein
MGELSPMNKQELEASINTLEILLIIFGVLVAIGVTGESIFGFKLWRKNNQLRTIQEQEISRLTRNADEANRARIKIEEKIKPRRLTVEQRKAVADKLGRFAGQHINFLIYSGESEISDVSDDIIAALGQPGAGWVTAVARSAQQVRVMPGILVEVKSHAQPTEKLAANLLVSALREEGNLVIDGPKEMKPEAERGNSEFAGLFDMQAAITITIGSKP